MLLPVLPCAEPAEDGGSDAAEGLTRGRTTLLQSCHDGMSLLRPAFGLQSIKGFELVLIPGRMKASKDVDPTQTLDL